MKIALDIGSGTSQFCAANRPLFPNQDHLEAFCEHCYSMSTGGLYPAPVPIERIQTGFFNQSSAEPVVNGNSYYCLVPFFNRLVQSSGLIQGSAGLASAGNGYVQNTSYTGNFTPIIMDTGNAQTPPSVSLKGFCI